MVLEEIYPRRSRYSGWASDGSLPSRLAELEDAEKQVDAGEHSATLTSWARSGPRLATLDVGPYLRLAASMTRTLAGASSIRDDLRELLVDLIATARRHVSWLRGPHAPRSR